MLSNPTSSLVNKNQELKGTSPLYDTQVSPLCIPMGQLEGLIKSLKSFGSSLHPY